MHNRKYLTIKEICLRLGVCPESLYRALTYQKIPGAYKDFSSGSPRGIWKIPQSWVEKRLKEVKNE